MGKRKLRVEVDTVYYDDEDDLLTNANIYDFIHLADDFFWSNESWYSMIKRNVCAWVNQLIIKVLPCR